MPSLYQYLPVRWEDIAALITIVSFIITLISLLENRHKNRMLMTSFFQFREILLHIQRHKDDLNKRSDCTLAEFISKLDGYEAVAAAGMHAIKPYSLGEPWTRYRRSIAVYHYLEYVKKGIRNLLSNSRGENEKAG